MTIAKVLFGAAVVLFLLAVTGVSPGWTITTGSVVLLTAAVSAAVAMEARDFDEGHPALELYLDDQLATSEHQRRGA